MAAKMKLVPISVEPDVDNFAKKYRIQLSTDGRVMYPDGSLGSTIIDLVNYHFNKTTDKPFDYSTFKQLLSTKNINVAPVPWKSYQK